MDQAMKARVLAAIARVGNPEAVHQAFKSIGIDNFTHGSLDELSNDTAEALIRTMGWTEDPIEESTLERYTPTREREV